MALLRLAAAAILAGAAVMIHFGTAEAVYERQSRASVVRFWTERAEEGNAHARYRLALLYARGQGYT